MPMTWKRWSHRTAPLVAAACLWTISACPFASAGAEQTQSDPAPAAQQSAQQPAQPPGQTPSQQDELAITTDSNLPDTHLGVAYLVRLEATGGVPRLHWRVEKGALPAGINLTEGGVLTGTAQQGGDFQFTASVRDSSGSQRPKRKDFVIHVISAFTLAWKSIARVNGNRIEGSAEVSNHTPDDIDLTFVVMAVASNGRATAIGYQHFPLTKGTTQMELPFGETLPPGGYVVHVDAIGEVAAKNRIYRQRMETPKPLQVTVGP
jgi:hypothetical protein